MTDTSQPLFLFGAGFCARALAAIWAGPVAGTVRSDASGSLLEASGIAVLSHMDHGAIAARARRAHVLVSAPPDETGCPGLAALRACVSEAASVTYLSTSGVYGDLDGGWAMEWSPRNPQTARARRRAAAEMAWRAVRSDVRIVRLPGLYGPGRSALDRLRAGTAQMIVKDAQVFSRAHVEDVASGLKALILARAGGVFHLCDDEASPPQDVTAFAADLLGINPPPSVAFAQAELSDLARSFYSECKRVSNARVKAATGWRPAYPTYREGLRAILAAGG